MAPVRLVSHSGDLLPMNRSCVVVVCHLILALSHSVARADIVAVGGSAVVAEPPSNIQNAQWTSDTEARIWLERETILSAPLLADAVSTGVVFQNGIVGEPGFIPEGTPVASYMLRTDPVTTGGGGVFYDGFIDFDLPILGVMFLRSTIVASDALLARPGVLYNQNSDRGLEVHSGVSDPMRDALLISADRLRIEFDWRTFAGTDDVRILIAVPAPGSLALLTFAGLPACRHTRHAGRRD